MVFTERRLTLLHRERPPQRHLLLDEERHRERHDEQAEAVEEQQHPERSTLGKESFTWEENLMERVRSSLIQL